MLYIILILSTSLPSHDINFEKCSDAIFCYSEGNGGRYGRYDLSMSYDDLWRHTAPHSPRQYAGYSLSYSYGTDDGTRFRLSTIAETHYRAENDTVGARGQTFHRYQYDGSGNLTYEESGHPVAGGAVNWKSGERKLLWDAENRLRALDENGYVYNPQNEMFQNNKTKRSVLQNEMFFLFYKFNYDNQLNQKKVAACKMKSMGFDAETIAKITGLTVEEIDWF